MARLPSFEEALAIATGATAAATPRGRRLAMRVGRGGVRLTTAIARRHPAIATAVVLAELGYIFEDDIRRVARDLRESMPSPAQGQGGSPTFSGESIAPKVRRKVSKANPNTKSKIGKGTSTVKRLARKIRKSVWGVTKRFKK